MEKKAFIIVTDRPFTKSGNSTEVIGRALSDISLGDHLQITKEKVRSVYLVSKLEAYRKSIEILYGMYGGFICLQLAA